MRRIEASRGVFSNTTPVKKLHDGGMCEFDINFPPAVMPKRLDNNELWEMGRPVSLMVTGWTAV